MCWLSAHVLEQGMCEDSCLKQGDSTLAFLFEFQSLASASRDSELIGMRCRLYAGFLNTCDKFEELQPNVIMSPLKSRAFITWDTLLLSRSHFVSAFPLIDSLPDSKNSLAFSLVSCRRCPSS